jgi:hypothetical protein
MNRTAGLKKRMFHSGVGTNSYATSVEVLL